MPRKAAPYPALPGADARLSVEGLLKILGEVVKDKNCKIPNTNQLAKLSFALQKARLASLTLPRVREAKAATEHLNAAIDGTEAAIFRHTLAMLAIQPFFQQLDILLNSVAPGVAVHSAGLDELKVKTDQARYALNDARHALLNPGSQLFQHAATEADRLQSYYPVVAAAFIEAMQAANPGITIGEASNTGPLPRFIEAIAPILSNETINQGSVKTLAKKVKRGNT